MPVFLKELTSVGCVFLSNPARSTIKSCRFGVQPVHKVKTGTCRLIIGLYTSNNHNKICAINTALLLKISMLYQNGRMMHFSQSRHFILRSASTSGSEWKVFFSSADRRDKLRWLQLNRLKCTSMKGLARSRACQNEYNVSCTELTCTCIRHGYWA